MGETLLIVVPSLIILVIVLVALLVILNSWKLDTVLRMQYKAQRDDLLEFIKNVPARTGVCCCGDSMDQMQHDNHTALDQWDYHVSQWEASFKEFDEKVEKKNG